MKQQAASSRRAAAARKKPQRVARGAFDLLPGNLMVSPDASQVRAIVASGVAVSLFDRRLGQGGICHFLLPEWSGFGEPSPRYGDIAIRWVIARLGRLGSCALDLEARVFGGSCIGGDPCREGHLGARNVESALRVLREEEIALSAADVDGDRARKVVFDPHLGTVELERL